MNTQFIQASWDPFAALLGDGSVMTLRFFLFVVDGVLGLLRIDVVFPAVLGDGSVVT